MNEMQRKNRARFEATLVELEASKGKKLSKEIVKFTGDKNKTQMKEMDIDTTKTHNLKTDPIVFDAVVDGLISAIEETISDFNKVRWGHDGDCGAQRIIDSLELKIEKQMTPQKNLTADNAINDFNEYSWYPISVAMTLENVGVKIIVINKKREIGVATVLSGNLMTSVESPILWTHLPRL